MIHWCLVFVSPAMTKFFYSYKKILLLYKHLLGKIKNFFKHGLTIIFFKDMHYDSCTKLRNI